MHRLCCGAAIRYRHALKRRASLLEKRIHGVAAYFGGHYRGSCLRFVRQCDWGWLAWMIDADAKRFHWTGTIDSDWCSISVNLASRFRLY